MNLMLPLELPQTGVRPVLGEVPTTVCFTMDKNRSWAAQMGLEPVEGHAAGRMVAETITQACFDAGVQNVVLWAMSESNRNKRSKGELIYLTKLLREALESRALKKNDADFYICGYWNIFNDGNLTILVDDAYEQHQPGRRTLTVLFGYRGISDFKQAASHLCEELGPEAIENEDLIHRYMWVRHLPRRWCMFARTGVLPYTKHNSDSLAPMQGEQAFVWDIPEYWPDFTVARLYEGLKAYGECQRRQGA